MPIPRLRVAVRQSVRDRFFPFLPHHIRPNPKYYRSIPFRRMMLFPPFTYIWRMLRSRVFSSLADLCRRCGLRHWSDRGSRDPDGAGAARGASISIRRFD